MSEERATIPDVREMDDETVMKHLEFRHPEVTMKFVPEPGRSERRMAAPDAWRGLHQANHRMYPHRYDHDHLGDGW